MQPETPAPQPNSQVPGTIPNSLAAAAAPTEQGGEVQKPGLIITPPSEQALKRRKALFWGAVSALVLVIISAICVLMFVNRDIKQAQVASDSFISALQAKESDRAYDQAGAAFQASTDKLKLAQATAQMNERIQGGTLVPVGSVVSKTENGTQAAIVYSVTRDNTTFYVRVVLDKVDGTWKVHNFRFAQQKLEAVVE